MPFRRTDSCGFLTFGSNLQHMGAWWFTCENWNVHTDACMCKNSSGLSTLITFLPVPVRKGNLFFKKATDTLCCLCYVHSSNIQLCILDDASIIWAHKFGKQCRWLVAVGFCVNLMATPTLDSVMCCNIYLWIRTQRKINGVSQM